MSIKRSRHVRQVQGVAHIEASVDGIVELESLLTAVPAMAPESGGSGEMKKAEALLAWLVGKGLTKIERFDAPDDRVPGGKRPNIVSYHPRQGRFRPPLDHEPPGRGAGGRPLHVEDGPLHRGPQGRTNLRAGRGRQPAGPDQFGLRGPVPAGERPEPTHTVKLLFVADEEYGSKSGIQYLLKAHDLFRKDDLIIIPDGGCKDGSEIEIAEKNICWLKVSTKGKQCHASTPDEGANAFLAACDLALRVHELEKTVFTARNPLFHPDRSTISPTLKEANVPNVNTIPGDDVFCLDMRVLPQYSVAKVLEEVEKVMREVEKARGVAISYEILNRNESSATKADAPVVKALSGAVEEVYGVKAKAIGIGGGTVGAYLRNAGFDCVVWARLEESAHQPNESALISNIVGDAKVFASLMLR